MKGSKIFETKVAKKKITASLFVLAASLGTMFVADNMNIGNIENEQSIISEIANKTLNISFVPNNPYMKNNVKLFNAITKTDVDNIAKIQGVKSVKPIDTEYNPLSGYLKVNSKSSYIELYGMSENGEDKNKDSIEMIYGRSINSNDRGKNVIVLNMETVNALQVPDAKSLIGTGVEINNAMYEVIGIMNVVLADERDNLSELEHSSLIPKSTSKEILARANAKADSYSAITVSIADGANANSVETSIYNLLYQKHEGINGYYERDVEYNLPKKLDPTLTILDNFINYLKVSIIGVLVLSLVAIVKAFRKTDEDYEELLDLDELEESNNEVVEVDLEVSEKVEEIQTVEDTVEIESIEKVEKTEDVEQTEEAEKTENVEQAKEVEDAEELETKKKSTFIKSNRENMLLILCVIVISFMASSYYLSGKNISAIFNISVGIKMVIALISIYIIKISNKK